MTGYRIIAIDKEQHFAFAEKVDNVRLLSDGEYFEVIDHKGRAWNERRGSIVFNPMIIKEVSAPWLYKIDLTEVGESE